MTVYRDKDYIDMTCLCCVETWASFVLLKFLSKEF